MTRRRSAVAAFVAAALLATVAGCATTADTRPIVAVTTNILGDVVEQLVGEQARVITLMPPGSDPHSFEISARQAASLADADLIVSNGLGLEEGVQRHVDAAVEQGVPAVVAGDLIEPIGFDDPDRGRVPDPHLWTDPQRMREVAAGLRDAIAEHVDGIDAAALRSAADAYDAQLATLDDDIADAFAELPGERRRLVTDHHVFGYLAERYDFEVIGAVVPSGTTLAAPSARDLDELATTIRDAGVPAIFVSTAQSDRLASVLAEHAGVDVRVVSLFTESLSGPGEGAETYLELMRGNAERIVRALDA